MKLYLFTKSFSNFKSNFKSLKQSKENSVETSLEKLFSFLTITLFRSIFLLLSLPCWFLTIFLETALPSFYFFWVLWRLTNFSWRIEYFYWIIMEICLFLMWSLAVVGDVKRGFNFLKVMGSFVVVLIIFSILPWRLSTSFVKAWIFLSLFEAFVFF